MLIDLIHILGDLESLRVKCENTFTCENCVLKSNKELCDTLLNLPEIIGTTIYGGQNRC